MTQRARTMLKKINLTIFKQLPYAQRRMTISSYITVARMLLSPVIVAMMIYRAWGVAVILFVIAALSDLLDGVLARLRNERTWLGAVLDPVADKILILSCFFTLAFFQDVLFIIPGWFVWAVLAKELLQIAGAWFLYVHQGYLQVQPTLLGKITTVAQMGFIGWLFACYFFQWVPIKTYYAMLGVLLVLTVITFLQYVCIGIRSVTQKGLHE